MRRGQQKDHQRREAARHRRAADAIRLVEDGVTGRSTASATSPNRYVGRVGGLAVALGVGAVIAGLPVVAAADTGTGNTGKTTSSARSTNSSSATRSAHGGSARHASHSTPKPSTSVRGGRRSTTPGGPGHAQRAPIPSRVSDVIGSDTAATPAPSDPSEVSEGSASTPAIETGPPASPVEDAPQIATVAMPAMTPASPHAALSATGITPLDRLGGGGDPLAPIAAPLAWAAVATSRRELLDASTTTTPAASVTTGEPAADSSAATDAPLTADVPTEDRSFWNDSVAPALTDFIMTGIHYADLNPSAQAFADALVPVAVQLVGDWHFHDPINQTLAGLATDQSFFSLVAEQVGNGLTNVGVPGAAADVIGDAVAYWGQTALGDSGFQTGFDTLFQNLTVIPNGWDLADLLVNVAPESTYTLEDLAQQDIAQSVDAVGNYLPGFLSDPTVQAALATATTNAVHVLAGISSAPWADSASGAFVAFIGDQIDQRVTSALGGGPVAAGVATAVSTTVQDLLADPVAVDGLLAVAGSAVESLLGSEGVPAALADVVDQVASAVAAGTDPAAALRSALQVLQADSAFRAAVGAAAVSAWNSLVADSNLVSTLAASASTLIIEVAADPDVRTFIGELVGIKYGDAVVSWLADSEAVSEFAASAGSVVADFLDQPGVSAALSSAVNQIATDTLAGVDLTDAVQHALQSLQADPAIGAAWNGTASTMLALALSDADVRQVVAEGAQDAVTKLLSGDGLNNSPLVSAAGDVTKAAVDSLLANPATRNLISDIPVDLANGTAPSELVNTLVQDVIRSPALQVAFGSAVGQGLGALFGDNPIGFFVGKLAGAAATLLIGMASGTTLLFDGLNSLVGGAAAFELVPSA